MSEMKGYTNPDDDEVLKKCGDLCKNLINFAKPFVRGFCALLDRLRVKDGHSYDANDKVEIYGKYIADHYKTIYKDFDDYTFVYNFKSFVEQQLKDIRPYLRRIEFEQEDADFMYYDILLALYRFTKSFEDKEVFKKAACTYLEVQKNTAYDQVFCQGPASQ